MKRGRKPKKVQPVQASGGPMECPADLDEVGVEAWQSICADLGPNLATTDAKILELYANTYSLLKRFDKQLKEEPLTTGGARPFINPVVPARSACVTTLRSILNDLKLTPAARAKSAPPLGGADEGDKWKL